jgi:hypothetical protein
MGGDTYVWKTDKSGKPRTWLTAQELSAAAELMAKYLNTKIKVEKAGALEESFEGEII